MRVLSSSPTIQFNMQKQSTLMSTIISLEIINKKGICIESVGTEDQLADIFTEPLDEKRFLQAKE
jgi:hypothetical protein